MKSKKRLTLKQARWVEETVKTLNPTEAARRVYKVKNSSVAKVIAHENLTKPYLQEALGERLRGLGLDDERIAAIHRRNLEQSENISASNTALDMLYKLSGAYAPEKRANLNVSLNAVSAAELDDRIRENTINLRRLGALPDSFLDELKKMKPA